MSIRFSCTCGKPLQVKDEQAGTRARCPFCRAVVSVPAGAQEEPESLPGVVPFMTCPKCKAEWPPETVVCVGCGYNFKTGKKLKTRYKVTDQFIDLGTTWMGTYTRFAVKRDKKGRRLF